MENPLCPRKIPSSFRQDTSSGDAPITSLMPTELKELYDQIVAAIRDWTDTSNDHAEFNEYYGAPEVDTQLVVYIAPLSLRRPYSHLGCLYAQPCAHYLAEIPKTMGLTVFFEYGKLKTVEVPVCQEQPDLIGTDENALMRMNFEREYVPEDDNDDGTAFPDEAPTPPSTALVSWIDHKSIMRKLSIDQDVLARKFWRSLSFPDRQLYFQYLSIYQEHLTPYLQAKAAWDNLVNQRPSPFGSGALQLLYRDWEDCEPEFYDLAQNVVERAKVLPEWKAFRKMKDLQPPVDAFEALIRNFMVPEIKFMQKWDEEKENRKAKGKRVITVACEDPDNAGATVVVEVISQPVMVSLPDPDLVTDFDEWVIYNILGIQCMADWHFEDEIPQAVLGLAANWEMGKGHTLPREPTSSFDLALATNIFERRFGGLVEGKKRLVEDPVPNRDRKRSRLLLTGPSATAAPQATPLPVARQPTEAAVPAPTVEEEGDQTTSSDESPTPAPTSNSRDATPDSVETSATSVEEIAATADKQSSQDIPQQSTDCTEQTETSSAQPEQLQAAQDQAPSANLASATEASSDQPKDSQTAKDQAQSGTSDAPQPEHSRFAQSHPQLTIAPDAQPEAQAQPVTPASLTEASGAQPSQVQSAQAEPQSATPAPLTGASGGQPSQAQSAQAEPQSSTPAPSTQPPSGQPSQPQTPQAQATPASQAPSQAATRTVSPDPTLLQNVGFAFQDASGNIPMSGYEIPRSVRWKNKRRMPDDEECDDSGYSSAEAEPRKKMKLKDST